MKITFVFILLLINLVGRSQNTNWTHNVTIITDSGYYLSKDTADKEWILPKITDSLATIKSLLKTFAISMRIQNRGMLARDSDVTKAYKIATRWANICKWVIEDQGMSKTDFMEVLRRKGYTQINLYNKKPSKKRRA